MEWDQYIFKKIYNAVAFLKKEKTNPLQEEASVCFEDIKPRLHYLTNLLCGCSMNIASAEMIGGWKGSQFYYPEKYSRAFNKEKNIEYYLFRTFFMYGQMRLSHFASHDMVEKDLYYHSQLRAIEVMTFLEKEFPSMQALFQSVLQSEQSFQKSDKEFTTEWLYGKWYYLNHDEQAKFNALMNPIKKNTVVEDKPRDTYTELKAKNKEDATVIAIDITKQEEYTLTHNFEKIETIDEFSGRWRDFDGSDELEEHSEALREADLSNLVRVDNPVHSIYRSEFVQSLGMIEASTSLQPFHYSYPEWINSQKKYKEDYCKIIYQKHTIQEPVYVVNAIQKNKKHIEKLMRDAECYLSDYYVRKRMPNGDNPDIDAVVEAYIDMKTGKTPSENLYIAKRKKTKDIAILVLIDCSLSTDGYTNNQRILDIEKEAMIMAGEVWRKMNCHFQIDTFSSRTHTQCFYTTFKAFHEDWNDVKNRIGAMQSDGYTRIGAALRHATYLLSQTRFDTKWLLLLSDGKPNDFDTYEGKYGIGDSRQAIREAEQKNIHLSAIAIDQSTKYYIPQIFGLHGYSILNHPSQLPESLTKFYNNLLK